jgi:hypothetical protein
MSELPALVIVSFVATVVATSTALASSDPVSTNGPRPAPGNGPGTEASFIAAIKDEQTSFVRAAPKCQDTALSGTLVMETPARAGFPFNATTFASPTGTFTTVTTTGDESATVIDEVGQTLNSRANNFVKRLLRSCSL